MLLPKNHAEAYYEPPSACVSSATDLDGERPPRTQPSWLIAARRTIAKALIRAGYFVAPPAPSHASRVGNT